MPFSDAGEIEQCTCDIKFQLEKPLNVSASLMEVTSLYLIYLFSFYLFKMCCLFRRIPFACFTGLQTFTKITKNIAYPEMRISCRGSYLKGTNQGIPIQDVNHYTEVLNLNTHFNLRFKKRIITKSYFDSFISLTKRLKNRPNNLSMWTHGEQHVHGWDRFISSHAHQWIPFDAGRCTQRYSHLRRLGHG